MKENSLRELWRYRELLYFFAWRDIKVRYRQASLGAAWAVIQPLTNMVLFTLLFNRLAHIPSDGIPYPLFCYCALVPWTYFSSVLAVASVSLTSNATLVEKVYFPRVLLPAGSAVAGLLDFVVGALLLAALMLYYHMRVRWTVVFIPLIVLVMVLFTTGISMLMAAANVRYRDVKHVVPFLIQIWMFATPIIYPATMIPEQFRPLLALNPCWALVNGFRACMFPGVRADARLMATSTVVALCVFIIGAFYFRRAEKSFADVI
jgi:lipopolysaccharide transport system permease protein